MDFKLCGVSLFFWVHTCWYWLKSRWSSCWSKWKHLVKTRLLDERSNQYKWHITFYNIRSHIISVSRTDSVWWCWSTSWEVLGGGSLFLQIIFWLFETFYFKFSIIYYVFCHILYWFIWITAHLLKYLFTNYRFLFLPLYVLAPMCMLSATFATVLG